MNNPRRRRRQQRPKPQRLFPARRPRLPPRAALSRSRVHRALKPAYCLCNAGKLGEAYEDAADRRVGKSRPDSRGQAALPRRHAGHSRRSPSAAFERGSAVYRGKRCPRGTESLQTPRWSEGDSDAQSQVKWRLHRHVILSHRTAVR